MEETNSQFSNFEAQSQKLPNATTVLVLGILSIITCCCYGVLSLLLGGVGLYLAKKDTVNYQQNPQAYTNYDNLKIGKILCIIGIVLGVIYLLYMIWILSVIGLDALQNPQLIEERIREITGQ